MDESARKFLEGMDRIGPVVVTRDGQVVGQAMYAAEEAEKHGLSVPWHELTFLVKGRPLDFSVPGPSLKMVVQVQDMPPQGEIDRLQQAAYRAANGAFHYQPVLQDMQIVKSFDPYGWGQYFQM